MPLQNSKSFLRKLMRRGAIDELEVPFTGDLENLELQDVVYNWISRDWEARDFDKGKSRSKEKETKNMQTPEYRCDVMLITPLAKEQEMLCLALGINWREPDRRPQGTKEFVTKINRDLDKPPLTIAVSCINRSGNVATAARAANIIERNKPKLAIMCGIGATIKDQLFGHVVGSTRIIYCDGGSQKRDGVDPRPEPANPDERYKTLLDNFDNVSDKNSWKNEHLKQLIALSANVDIDKPTKEEIKQNGAKFSPAIIYSGNKLRRDGGITKELAKVDERARSVEMEGYGFALACEEKRVPWLVFRGHCDYGDDKKNDLWQRVAALSATISVCSFLYYECLMPEEMEFD